MPVLNITAIHDRLDALERRLDLLEGVAVRHLEQHDADEYATVDLMQRSIETLATRLDRSLDRLSHDIRVVANRASEGR